MVSRNEMITVLNAVASTSAKDGAIQLVKLLGVTNRCCDILSADIARLEGEVEILKAECLKAQWCHRQLVQSYLVELQALNEIYISEHQMRVTDYLVCPYILNK